MRRPVQSGSIVAVVALALLGGSSNGVSAAASEPAPAVRDANCGAACVDTLHVDGRGVRYAYRRLGPQSGRPLILLNRFRGTMDEWDPLFIDALARTDRPVILFDNVGVARTAGEASPRLTGWADGAAAFIDALGYDEVDVLGFSFGGLVAQELAYRRPELVRRLVIAGSGAGYVEGANLQPRAIEVATRAVNTDEDFLYLFFRDTATSQAAGRAHLARLRQRRDAFAERVSETTWRAMLSASSDVGSAETSLLNRAPGLNKPVLVANGVEDVMIPTVQSFALARALPDARLLIYPDSGHAFMFQFPEDFAAEVGRFLDQ